MADASLLTMTQISEAQITADSRLYAVYDPTGSPQDLFLPIGSISPLRYKITPSVASNNLTVALKHLDGTDPSTTKPLVVKVGDNYELIVAALSVTKNAGTNWCNAGSAEMTANDIQFFVYVIQETGAAAGTKIGFSRISHATTMADFVNTAADEKYIPGSWTNFNATDAVTLIGRFNAQLSASASFNWSIPTAKVVNYPIFETDLLTWTAQTAGFASDPVASTGRYKVCPDRVELWWYMGSPAASDATTFTATAPFKCKTGFAVYWPLPNCYDNSTNAAVGLVAMSSNSNLMTMYKTAFGSWTASNNKSAGFTGSLMI
jgi:hypothetical protein